MNDQVIHRRRFLMDTGQSVGVLAACGVQSAFGAEKQGADNGGRRGSQRLSLERLKQFESLGYGMFISFDIEAFTSVPIRSANLTEVYSDDYFSRLATIRIPG